MGETDARALAKKLGLSGSNVIGNWENRGTPPNAMAVADFVDLYPMLSTDYIWRGDKSRLSIEILQKISETEARLSGSKKTHGPSEQKVDISREA